MADSSVEYGNLLLQITQLQRQVNQLSALNINDTNNINSMKINYATVPVSASSVTSEGCSLVNNSNLTNVTFNNNFSNCVKGTGTATKTNITALIAKINAKITALTNKNATDFSDKFKILYGYDFTSPTGNITSSSTYGKIQKDINTYELLDDSINNSLYEYNKIYFFYLFLFLHVCFLIYYFVVFSLPVLIDPQNANLPKPNYFIIIIFAITLLFFGYNYYLDIINKLIIYLNNLIKYKIKI
jgi:hypothetical protein